MKYKLLVLDVDGTLLNDAKEISKRTLAALLKVQQMGVRIVLASGRPTYGLMPLAKMLELGNYGGFILSYNGCQIINAQNGEILFERRINPEMLPYLEKKARKNGFALFTYHDDTIITDSPENEHIQTKQCFFVIAHQHTLTRSKINGSRKFFFFDYLQVIQPGFILDMFIFWK